VRRNTVLTNFSNSRVFHIFPSMGWGLPDSPGHYLDLVSAVFGLALLGAGLVVRAISRTR
jgi:hypothetical protein